jgi:hypothetical protein
LAESFLGTHDRKLFAEGLQNNFLLLIAWHRKGALKELCHEINIFLKAYNKKHAMIVFMIFCLLVDEKLKIKLVCSLEITYECLKILPVNHFKDPKAAILTLKMLSGSHL